MADFELNILQYIKQVEYFSEKDGETRKRKITRLTLQNMIRRTARLFEWKGLPDTIPQRVLELSLQTRGVMGIIKHEEKYYAVWGTLGGISNYNYMPSDFIVANPYLPKECSRTYHIYDTNEYKKDVVIIPNDTLYQGLLPLLSIHAELLTEIQLTKRCLYIFNRVPSVLTAPDNNGFEDVKSFLKDLKDGEIASIFDRNFMKNVSALNLSDGARNLITQMLEAEQYQKAAMFNDIGLQMNYNMKRETITSSEAQLGESALLPLCDDMLEMRRVACEEAKELWGLELSVDFSSAWKDLRKSIELETKKMESEVQPEQVQTIGQESSTEEVQTIGQESSTEEVQTFGQESSTEELTLSSEEETLIEEAIENLEEVLSSEVEDETST